MSCLICSEFCLLRNLLCTSNRVHSQQHEFIFGASQSATRAHLSVFIGDKLAVRATDLFPSKVKILCNKGECVQPDNYLKDGWNRKRGISLWQRLLISFLCISTHFLPSILLSCRCPCTSGYCHQWNLCPAAMHVSLPCISTSDRGSGEGLKVVSCLFRNKEIRIKDKIRKWRK